MGKMEGRGVEIWNNGMRYEGSFKNGNMWEGVFTWADGHKYGG